MTSIDRETPTPDVLPHETLDARLLEAGSWRLHRVLARHWLHALRGSLNAMSLNIVLLGGDGRAAAGSDKAPQALRGYVRELDTALTRFLDQSWLDEAPDGSTDASAIVSSVRTLLDPLAKRLQVRIETSCPEPGPTVALDARTVHAVVSLLLADALDRTLAKGVVTVTVHQAPGAVRIAWPPAAAPARSGLVEPATLAAVARVLQRAGGEIGVGPDALFAVALPPRSFAPGGFADHATRVDR